MKINWSHTWTIAGFSFAILIAGFGRCELRSAAADKSPGTVSEAVFADEAKTRLEKGNRRCVEGKSAHGHNLAHWRERYSVKQKPFATVLGCSDSRVPPELLFDQGFDELFVIRVAGNIVDPAVIATIQYSIEHLDNKLIIVLGHQNCGAVTAALTPAEKTESEPRELQQLLNRIRPAIETVDSRQDFDRRVAAAVEANVHASVKQLRQVLSIASAIKPKNVRIVGAVYNIDSGQVRFLDSQSK